MRKFLVFPALSLLALSSGAFALPQAAPADSHNPMVKDSTVRKTVAPASGISSFTQAQARGRIAKAGYSGVSKLTKDGSGAWMGMAMKGGKKLHVALDYKGNVTER